MPISIFAIAVLCFVIVVSASQRVNVGLLAFAAAIGLGLVGGMQVSDVLRQFPVDLMVVLVAVTYFFGITSQNGTLNQVTNFLLRLARGRAIILPIIFFFLAMGLSTIGVGNIAAVALLAPAAMAVAERTKLGAFFMAIMLINGANAGTFSPFAYTGIIANGLVAKLGLTMEPWRDIYLPSFFMQTTIAFANYFIFYFLLKDKLAPTQLSTETNGSRPQFDHNQTLTIFSIALLVFGVVVFKMDVGFLALVLALVLTLLKVAPSNLVVKSVPWNILLMVCGVSTLVSIVENTGGITVLIEGLARISDPKTAPGVLAFVVGVVSSFSSSSAVVMPTFIPLVPGLIAKMGAGDAVALVSAVNVGTHVVDVSPLSTLGALCLANAGASENKVKLFRKLLVYGLSMSLVGAAVSFLFFGLR